MWKIFQIANGRKSCDNFDLESSDMFKVLSALEEHFEISYSNKAVFESSMSAIDLRINEQEVTIGWDNWSGIYIMARKPAGDIVVERIYEFLVNDEKERNSLQEKINTIK